MTYSFDFLEEALLEAEEAIEYYNEVRNGYGRLFYDKLFQKINAICNAPERYQKVIGRPELRKAAMNKPFAKSYTIYFYFNGEGVVIVSVFHNRRNPDTWKKRNV